MTEDDVANDRTPLIPPLRPPQPTNNNHHTEPDRHARNDSEHEFDMGMDMETPLVSHGNRKSSGPVFRSQLHAMQPSYSAIAEGRSETGTASRTDTGDEQTLSDADDDRSVSTVSTAASVSSLSTITTVYLENFQTNLMIPFTDEEGSWPKIVAGLGALAVIGTLVGLIMPKNQTLPLRWYRYMSSVIGYNYFVLWSVCFYPQVLLNYRRKSTKGLSNDFAILNFMGWSYYSAYLSSMYFSAEIREMYAKRFTGESSTVQSNDVAFAIHAMILSFIYLVQIVYYGKKRKKRCCPLKLKLQTWVLVLGMGLPSIIVPLLIMARVLEFDHWLDYFYILSFFKICCTLTKYSKQVMLNYQRKSTAGWNIWYNFLECTGGTLSMMQVVLDSFVMNNMTGITGNLAKFALGLATLFFDAIFFTQHYVLYPAPKEGGDDQFPELIRANSRLRIEGHRDSFDEFDDGMMTDDEQFPPEQPAQREKLGSPVARQRKGANPDIPMMIKTENA